MPVSRKKKKGFSPLLLVLILLAGWSALWGVSAYTLRHAVETWVAQSESKPFRLEMASPTLSGYPFAVIWHFTEVKGHNEKGVAFAAKDVLLHAHPWDGRHFNVTADETTGTSIPLPGDKQALSFRAEAADGRLSRDDDEGLRLTGFELLNVALTNAAGPLFKADGIEFALRPAATPATTHKEASATVTLKARGILLAESKGIPLGNRIAAANALVRVMGPLPDFSDKADVAKWNAENGVLECDRVNLVWGPLSLEMNGTLALSPALQPEGAFSGRVVGLKPAIQALTQTGALEKRQAATLRSTLNLFAKPVSGGEGGEVEVPLTLQAGALSLGPVKLLNVPPLAWD
jgi:hypothetical protein